VSNNKGSEGGYRLLVPSENLTMLDVVEAVIGEIFLNDFILAGGGVWI